MIEDLLKILGRDGVVDSPDTLKPYLTDWRGRYTGQAAAMALPQNTQQVQQLVQYCRAKKIALIPQGGNTGLVGGATPDIGSSNILVNLRRMNRIHTVDSANQSILVECGAVVGDIQKLVSHNHLIFPLMLTPIDRVQIGGALATNAGGLNVLRYGMMRHLCLGIEAVLGNGDIFSQMRPLRKNNFGYAFGEMLIGSEGTLGILTQAQLRLFPRPKAQALMWVGLPDFESCIDFYGLAQSITNGLLSACEYMSRQALQAVAEYPPRLQEPFGLQFPHSVLIQLDGESEREVISKLKSIGKDLPPTANYQIAADLSQQSNFWEIRKNIAVAERHQGLSVKHDLSLPLGQWKEFITVTSAELEKKYPGLKIIALGHLGDGNLHYNIAPRDITVENYDPFAAEINLLVFENVMRLGGSPAAEHGVGVLRRPELQKYISKPTLDLWRGFKNICDPDGIMNPGKIF